MFKNRIKKFIITLLSVLLITPAFTVNTVLADEVTPPAADVTTVFLGVDYEYDVKEYEFKDLDDRYQNFNDEDVKEYIKLGVDKIKLSYCEGFNNQSLTDIFDNGKYIENATNDIYANYVVSDNKATIKLNFHSTGEFLVTLGPKDEAGVANLSAYFKKFRVVDNVDDEYLKLEYKDFTQSTSAIDKYDEQVQNAIKDGNDFLTVGKDSFKVPKVDSLINSSFAYSNVKKTVYYCLPGELSYKNTTATSGTPSFSVSKYGTYRFYTLLESDNLVDNVSGKKQVSVTGLKEFNDGFYQVCNGDDKVYYNAENNLYYNEITFENLVNDDGKLANEEKKTKIVPIFEFTLEKAQPKIEINAQILEDGYKGAKYASVGKVSVYGNPEAVTYTLQYRESHVVNWTDLKGEDEMFNADDLSFIPKNLGEYRIKIVARSDSFPDVEEYTPVIKVSQEYIEYQYKVSFSDWLSVNVLPFVLLCISALCLIGIILLLVIKPKNKTNKIQIKEEDR